MKPNSSSRRSKTNYRRLRNLGDTDVRVTAEHPEADLKHIAKGIVRRGLKVVGPKELVSLRIDADVLKWFKASGAGYQTRINAVLRAYKDAAAG
ncbi:MAG: BrnA antitoxin family protein [Gammaproteobacteria bacterium]|nr:MAG: BrnA antitoxin family protein [Gammaproteobacteria bacterium]